MGTFRELVVWQKAFALCLEVYNATDKLPSHERYGLTSELRKTARSVICNIAEGHQRLSRKEFLRFIDIAYASAAELETQLLIAEARCYFEVQRARDIFRRLDEVKRMLAGLKATLARSLTPDA